MICSKVIIQYHFLIPQRLVTPAPFNFHDSLTSKTTLSLAQVPSLTCRISILHQFEPCAHAFDWQVGVSAPEFFFYTDQ